MPLAGGTTEPDTKCYRSAVLLFLALALLLAGPAHAESERPAPPPVVFLSDFGTGDDAVAAVKGVMLGIDPRLQVIDLTHQVRPYAIADGARLLADTAPFYPKGTVFLAVVDPGVGSTRKPMVARSSRGQWFVLPDNGLITLVAERDGLESAREITNPAWLRTPAVSSTFHGRDVFAPVAAHLARGDDWTEVGPVIAEPVRLPLQPATVDAQGLHGQVIAIDGPYGNLITDVDAATFSQLGYAAGDKVHVRLAGRTIDAPLAHTFSDVPRGAPLLFIDSRGRVGLALNQDSFARRYNVTVPSALAIPRKGPVR
jgi:S-adenosyl-L-methionine hydrolase (adenosine-forming)